MQLGIFDPIFGRLSLDAMLTELGKYREVTAIELGTGGFPGSDHVEVDALLASKDRAREFCTRFEDAGLTISALSCHGNPVHPNARVAHDADAVFRKTVRLAERLDVATVVTLSGCPGGAAEDVTPNWITTPWPPEYMTALNWQWEEKLIPYWRDAAQFAAHAGVRVAIEARPGFCVYNTSTLQRLRHATSNTVGMNLDPSHLWWQGMDVVAVIGALGEAIHHVHAKDLSLSARKIAKDGLLDNRGYDELGQRPWMYRAVGWGHTEFEWRAVLSALRLAGYDGALSIEHEDGLIAADEGLASAVAFLSRILLREKPVEAWWSKT
jgi:sugar phosphate isomerase/epimerase